METYAAGDFGADIDGPDFGSADFTGVDTFDIDASFDDLAAQTELDDLEAAFALPDAEVPANHPEAASTDLVTLETELTPTENMAAIGTLVLQAEVAITEIADEANDETATTSTELLVSQAEPAVELEVDPATDTVLDDEAQPTTAPLEPLQPADIITEYQAEPVSQPETSATVLSRQESGAHVHDDGSRAVFGHVLEESGLSLDTVSTYLTRGMAHDQPYTETISYAQLAPGTVLIESGRRASDGSIDNEVVIAQSLGDYLHDEQQPEPQQAALIVSEQATVMTSNEKGLVAHDTQYDLQWRGSETGNEMPADLKQSLQQVYEEQPWQTVTFDSDPLTVEYGQVQRYEPGTEPHEVPYRPPNAEAVHLAQLAVDAVRDAAESPTVYGPGQV